MTFLDYPDWRQGRDEWVAERLNDQDDIAAWRAETEHARITPDEMVSWWACERADAMAEYDARDYGWCEQDDDGNVTIVGKGADDVDYPGAP